ncbi:hypothetical protein PFICI_05159 [Pestalotiopsis fici W106-1]|uniref:RBR-type E3 ubiquitin transferase n=1 Tax=Pestalotiopsis fici (strain W106-1 / CGMCC3.15140) TaxID=1229662 RepID=W3XB28_PESFW|nr:uncharacterized protein PFICI_05159 [Pestalotiopsis fici W106-1]ETS83283.1 hypothetical protein PFICI_05159 [Pestalotiopsis fici W106-1]
MAYSQDGGGKHRHRRRKETRSPSLSNAFDWEPEEYSTLHSLPYRTRSRTADVDIQMPDSTSRRARQSVSSSSHRGRRASSDSHEIMPPTTTTSYRARAVPQRRAREPMAYDDDEESPSPRERRSRPRGRDRARSPSRSISGSERSSSSRGERVMTPSTPPRSTRVKNATPDSRRSHKSPSRARSRSSDSESTLSTQGRVKEKLRHESDEIEVILDTKTTPRRRHRKTHAEREPPIYEEELSPIARNAIPIVVESKGAPRHQHRHQRQSDSRSGSRRRHRHHHDHHDEVVKLPSSKRSHKKYHDSVNVYVERPKLARSSSSQMTNTPSVASSRRSSTALTKFMYGKSPQQSKPTRTVECVACMDEDTPRSKAAKLKCKHYMCHSCMKRVFKVSIKDPQHMPPKCCTEDPIPIKHVDALFENSFKKTWNKKFAEYSTRNRIYCPSSKCGAWIKPERIHKLRDGRKRATCGSCKTEVCCACNGRWHKGKDCPRDEATNEILKQAKENGWKRCYSCLEMIELKEGCNHMTCRCGAEFCMICGLQWKTCECPWFNYETAEQDHLDYMDMPMTSSSERDGSMTRGSRQRGSRHRVPQTYETEMSLRRRQEQQDEDFARRLQYDDNGNDDHDDDDDDDEEDDYIHNKYGEIVGLGNSAGHFMNDDYRRAPRIVPPAPSPPMQAVDRTGNGDYVTGVKKARGLRASSMERRLADRFSEPRHGSSPTHMSYTMPMPPHPPHPPPPPSHGMPMGGMSPMGMTSMGNMHYPPPGVPRMRRAHTMDDEMSHSRLSERIMLGHGPAEFEDDISYQSPPSRRRPRETREPRERERLSHRSSMLAGLTGPGSGMNRVDEWRYYVTPDEPERQSVTAR